MDTTASLDRAIELLKRRADEMEQRRRSYLSAIEYLEQEKRELEIDPTSAAIERS